MSKGQSSLNAVLSVIAVISLNLHPVTARANDIIASEDVVRGSSVFVFRESRKRPQEQAGSRFSGRDRRSYRERLKAQIAASRRRKAEAARARQAAIARARARERMAKLRLSNTLAAAAEKKMAEGNVEAAIVDFRASLTANPKNAEAKSGLSEALTANGMQVAGETLNEAAIVLFEEAAKMDPLNDVAFAKLGELHDHHGRNDLALANYEKALALDSELSSLYLPVASAHLEAGNLDKAELWLTKAESRPDAGGDIRFAKGVLLFKQNKLTESLSVLQSLAGSEQLNSAVHHQLGSVYEKLGRSPEAVASYRRAVETDPANAAAWFDLGVHYYNTGDYKNAEAAYKAALKADPTNSRAHANLASTYRQQERYSEANAEYKLAAEGIKDDPSLYSEWGYCLGKVNDWEKATARLQTAQAMGSTAVDDTNVGWAYYNAAQADWASDNEAGARAKLESGRSSLEKAVQKDPELDAAHLNLGSTYNSLGQHDKAAESLNEAVRLRSDWVIALNQLGIAYRGSNNLPMALSQFNRVVLLDGNNVAGLFNLGATQNAAGDKKGAKKTQERLKKLRPDLADQLGNIIAGRVIDFGTQKLREKIRIPGIPF
jgi:tetratricopeptide (TPR) repeat protein